MNRVEDKKFLKHLRYATLENAWFSLLIVMISCGGLFLICIGTGLVLERAGVSNNVLRWITPIAYLAYLVVRARLLVRVYPLALTEAKTWFQFLGAALVALFVAQIDPWWLGVVIFFGVLAIFEFINLLVILGKENTSLFQRQKTKDGDASGS